jgi:hypothetical protein
MAGRIRCCFILVPGQRIQAACLTYYRRPPSPLWAWQGSPRFTTSNDRCVVAHAIPIMNGSLVSADSARSASAEMQIPSRLLTGPAAETFPAYIRRSPRMSEPGLPGFRLLRSIPPLPASRFAGANIWRCRWNSIWPCRMHRPSKPQCLGSSR